MGAKTIGIIGTGKLGTVLAQLALKAGYRVYVSGSGDPKNIELTLSALAPGAVAATSEEVATKSNVIVLALPLNKFRELPKKALAHKLVIDATNYWWEVDGPRNEILPNEQSSSEAVQEFLADTRVVKTFSHMGYHHLHDESKPTVERGRKAIAVAGNSEQDSAAASQIVDDFGFDPVYIGPLAAGRHLEPGSPVFGANVEKDELVALLQSSGLNEQPPLRHPHQTDQE